MTETGIEKEGGRESLFGRSVYSVIARAWLGVGRVLFYLMVANLFGPVGQGALALAITVTATCSIVGSLGLELANTYSVGRGPARTGAILGNSLLVAAGSGGLVAGIFLLLYQYTKEGYFAGFPGFWNLAIALGIPLFIIQIYLNGILVGRRNFKAVAAGFFIQYLFVLAALFIFYLSGWGRFGLLMPLWVGGIGLSDLFLLVVVAGYSPGGLSLDRLLLREQLTFGLKGYISNLSGVLNLRLDMFIVAAFLTRSHLGWYSVAASVAEVLLYLPKALAWVTFAQAASEGRRKTGWDPAIMYRVVTGTLAAAALAIGLSAGWLIPFFFSAKFAAAVTPLRILLFGTFALGIGLMASHHLYGLGDAASPSKVSLLAVIATVVLDMLLIPFLGIVGAALASAVSYSLYSVLLIRCLAARQEVEDVADWLVPGYRSVASLARSWRSNLKGG